MQKVTVETHNWQPRVVKCGTIPQKSQFRAMAQAREKQLSDELIDMLID